MTLLFILLLSVLAIPVNVKAQSDQFLQFVDQGYNTQCSRNPSAWSSPSMSSHTEDEENAAYFGALQDTVLKAVTNSLKRAVAKITERQDAIEKKTDEQLESFNSLLVPLRHAIQERFGSSSISSDVSSAHSPSSPAPTSPTSARGTVDTLIARQHGDSHWNQVSSFIFCHLCALTFANLVTLDGHIRAEHPSLHCELCDKTLRSKPDLNLHNHKYHCGHDSDSNISTEAEDCQSRMLHQEDNHARDGLVKEIPEAHKTQCDTCGFKSEKEVI